MEDKNEEQSQQNKIEDNNKILEVKKEDDKKIENKTQEQKSVKKEGILNYFQRAGIVNWPLAQKYAIFRPFAWLYQLCRYTGKGIAGLFTGKKVFMKNKTKMSLEELWERLE